MAARQPRISSETSADSTGYSFPSDVTSSVAALSRSSQPSSRCGAYLAATVEKDNTSLTVAEIHRLQEEKEQLLKAATPTGVRMTRRPALR